MPNNVKNQRVRTKKPTQKKQYDTKRYPTDFPGIKYRLVRDKRKAGRTWKCYYIYTNINGKLVEEK